MFGLHNKSEEYSVWISPSPPCSGASGVFPVVSEIPSVFTRNAEGPEVCGSGVFIAEGVDGAKDKGSGNTIMFNVETFL